MAKYIQLDAVLAEIDKVMAEEMKFYETACKEGDEEVSSSPMVYTRLQILRSSIDALEGKEVDYAPIDNDFERDSVQFCFDNSLNTTPRIAKTIAKHFFELGLKIQKKE